MAYFAGQSFGTLGADLVIGLTGDTVIGGTAGDDVLLGDIPVIASLDEATSNGTPGTALNLDADTSLWRVDENPLVDDWTVPYRMLRVAATTGQPEVFSLSLASGQQLTVDLDFGGTDTPDLRVDIYNAALVNVSGSDNSAISEGGYGSLTGFDPFLKYTATTAGTYYIFVAPASGPGAFPVTTSFLLNVSVTGHAAVDPLPYVGEDVISGGFDDDQLLGAGGDDMLDGGEGHDILDGGSGNDILKGAEGNDRLVGHVGTDYSFGGIGNDTHVLNSSSDMVIEYAAEGTDTVQSSASHTLSANVENLTLFGASAIGGTGNSLANIITGNNAANVINGLGGNDTLRGNNGNDTLNGGDGHDTFNGGAGNDVMNGGAGIDTVTYSTATGGVTLRLSVTTAQATGGAGTDTVTGIERATGSAFADTLTGNAGANILTGGDGNDRLLGATGNDLLRGGAGNDVLVGGGGTDTLLGEAGADIFRFESPLGTSNVDTISGFSAASDTIQLDRTVFTALPALGTLSASAFHTGAAAADSGDRIIYNDANGLIYYDRDGTGAGDPILFAQVAAGLTLTNADFVIIA